MALEKEARNAFNLFLATSKLFTSPQDPLPAETAVQLVEPVEISRNDTTRECSGKILVDDIPAVPIEYEVTIGEDGQAYYRWNEDEFGKSLTVTMMQMTLSRMKANGAQSKPGLQAHPP